MYKVAILAPDIEPGHCGVGDYAIRFAHGLRSLGHDARLIGFNGEAGKILSDGDLQIRHSERWEVRNALVSRWMDDFNPDFVSLQFVIFSFHRKGVPFDIVNRVSSLSCGRPLHIMMHELWVGMNSDSTLKLKLWGGVQRSILRKMLLGLPIFSLNVSNSFYRNALKALGFESDLLPLFSNIPVLDCDSASKRQLFFEAGIEDKARVLAVGFFGSVHDADVLVQAAALACSEAGKRGLRPALLGVGRSGRGYQIGLEKIKRSFSRELILFHYGEQLPSRVSIFLKQIDIGVVTSPKAFLGKSGTFAAMRDHGVLIYFPSGGRLIPMSDDSELSALPVSTPVSVAESIILAAARAKITPKG